MTLDTVVYDLTGPVTIVFPGSSADYEFDFDLVGSGTDRDEILNKYSWHFNPERGSISWTIRINLAEEDLKNVSVRDVLEPGHEIIPESFTIYTTKFAFPTPTSLNPVEVDWRQREYIGTGGLQIDADNMGYTLQLGDLHSKTYMIDYETRYTGDNIIHRDIVKNKAKLTYDGKSKRYEAEYEYDWITGGATGYKKASVVLTKIDENGHFITSSQATFSLYTAEGELVAANLKTDANGFLPVENLASGRYYFVETAAPEGYVADDERVHFTIVAGQPPVTVQKVNKQLPITGDLQLTKFEQGTDNVLQGAVFNLMKDGAIIQADLVTNEDGQIKVANLAPGEYQFVETAAPNGYVLNDEPQVVTVTTGETATIAVMNKKQREKGAVVLTKVDSKDIH